MRRRRSRKLWPVGPVTTESPIEVNSGQALNSARDCSGLKPKARARATVVGSAMAPADRVLPSMPSEPALRTAETLAGMVGELESAGQGKLLIAAAGAWCARKSDGDLADRDEAESARAGRGKCGSARGDSAPRRRSPNRRNCCRRRHGTRLFARGRERFQPGRGWRAGSRRRNREKLDLRRSCWPPK